MHDFSSFINRYYISADIVMEKPLHIGKGVSLEPIGTDLPIIKNPDGKPVIPGSSIKGVLRAQMERILRTMSARNYKINGKTVWACDILDERHRCITPENKERLEKECRVDNKIDDEKLTQKILENSCVACILFGSQEIASKVYIKDAVLNDSTYPIRTEIRDGVAIDRDTGTAKAHMKYDYEIVPAGATFSLEVILENVEPWEVGLFGFLIKLWENGEIALGGKTSTGLGWSKLKNIQMNVVDSDKLIDFIVKGKKEPADLDSFVELLKKQLEKVEGDVDA